MDAIQIHLLINHVPILGSIFGFILLGFGLISKNKIVVRTGLSTLVVVALITIPAFLSGEEAEELVEHLPGTYEYELEEHEEHAEVALWLMEATGALALIALILSLLIDKGNKILNLLTLIMALLTVGAMAIAGHHGGLIRHWELRQDSVKKANQIENPAQVKHDNDDDDD